MDRNKNQVLEQWLEQWMDAAACEALAANSPADSAAYGRELATATSAGRRMDRELRDTAAMLSAASPYMQPPADLRGRVLQATAPATFRMDDYRKLNREAGRFYRWGFYAAILCLMAGAGYTLNLKNALTQTQGALAAASHQAQERNIAIEAILNPNADQITFRVDGKVDGRVIGKAFKDEKTMTAVVILPEGMVPPGKSPQLSYPRNGVQMPYKTVLLTVPANMLNMPPGKSVDSMLAIKDLSPDPKQPQIAGK